MPSLIVLKGLPLSGKTEWALKWVSEKQQRVRVSWTDILQSMGRGQGRLFRPLAVDAACRLMCMAFEEGCDVVLDECNLYPPQFAPFLTRAVMAGANVEYKTIAATIEEVKRRNAQLGHPARDMELERLAEAYRLWLEQ